MELKSLHEEIRSLRSKTKQLHKQNKDLKQQISRKRSGTQERSDKQQAAIKEEYIQQRTLHGYVGVWATIKRCNLEVHFQPSYKDGKSHGHYEIIFSIGKKSWNVLGCRLPPCMCMKVQGKVLSSFEDLKTFVREVRREIQTYVQRKIQVESSERIFKDGKVPGDIWYSQSFQQITLRFPVYYAEKSLQWEIRLLYDPDHCLPKKVLTHVEGLEQGKLEKMSERLEHLFETYSVDVILKEEFADDNENLDSTISIEGGLT